MVDRFVFPQFCKPDIPQFCKPDMSRYISKFFRKSLGLRDNESRIIKSSSDALEPGVVFRDYGLS